MQEWLQAVGAALPVVAFLALVVWMAIVYHGDSRWLSVKEAKKMQDSIDTVGKLLMGQNEKTADHETQISRQDSRISRLEERDVELFVRLDTIAEKLGLVGDRMIRLEEIPKRMEAMESRMNARRSTDPLP